MGEKANKLVNLDYFLHCEVLVWIGGKSSNANW